MKMLTFEVFGFLSSMTTTAILIPWAIICLTYLRLRKAVVVQKRQSVTVPEAKSRFQPWLAIYAFGCCAFLGILLKYYEKLTNSHISRF
jgi:amino acid permease